MKKLLLIISGTIFGGIVGFAYYYFIGCKFGTCPISSNPYISILWGMVIGVILSFPNQKKKNED